MLSCNRVSSLVILVLSLLLLLTFPAFSQNTEMVQVGPPPIRRAEPPAPSASAGGLEGRGEHLRAEKRYLGALGFLAAGGGKTGPTAPILNRSGELDR